MHSTLLLVLVAVTLVASTSVTYYFEEYEDSVEKLQSVFFEANLDPGLMLDYSSASWKCQGVGRVPAPVIPCCPGSGCWTPSSPNATCIDTNAQTISVPINTTLGLGVTQLQFKLQSFTCIGTFISVTPVTGVVVLDVWTGSPRTYLVSEPTEGSIIICCENLPQAGWDGIITIDVLGMISNPAVSSVSFTIQIFPDSTSLPLKSFPDLTELSITFSATDEQCTRGSTYCIINPIATDDTYYHDYRRIFYNDPLPTVQNKLVWEFVVSNTSMVTQQVNQQFGWDILGANLDNATAPIKVQFTNLLSQNITVMATQIHPECTYNTTHAAEFNAAVNNLKTPIPTGLQSYQPMGRLTSVMFDEYIGWKLQGLIAPLLSKTWVGCKDLIEKKLSRSQITGNQTQYIISQCLQIPNTTAWMTDPCCNFQLLDTMCCAQTPVTSLTYSYIPALSNALNNYCAIDGETCVTTAVNKYISANAGADTCSSSQPLVPDTTESIFEYCSNYLSVTGCTTDFDCMKVFPKTGGYCKTRTGVGVHQVAGRFGFTLEPSGLRACVPFCTTSADCPYGNCTDRGGWSECAIDPSNDPYAQPDRAQTLANCITKQILLASTKEQFFKPRVLQALGLPATATNTDITNMIITKARVSSCPLSIDAFHTVAPPCPYSLGQLQTCNSLFCDAQCSFQCPPPRSSPSFCGRALSSVPTVKQEISQFGTCVLFSTISNQNCRYAPYLATTQSSYWDSLDSICRFAVNADFTNLPPVESECQPASFCTERYPLEQFPLASYRDLVPWPAKGFVCLPTCVDPSKTNQTCTNGRWNVNRCELSALTEDECYGLSNSNTWWPGSIWLTAQYNDSQKCISQCPSNPAAVSKSACVASSHCTNPFCQNCQQSACVNSGYCTAEPGCYFPLDTNGPTRGSCPASMINALQPAFPTKNIQPFIHWTPAGCTLKFEFGLVINRVTCESKGGTYRSFDEWINMNRTQCEGLAQLCYLGANKTHASTSVTDPWPGYTIDPPAACTACQGTIVNGFQYIQGEWVPNSELDWLEVTFTSKALVDLYTQPATTLDQNLYTEALGMADLLREIDFVQNRITCLQAPVVSVLPTIGCLCRGAGQDNSTITECGCNPAQPPPAVISGVCASFTVCSTSPGAVVGCIGSYKVQGWPGACTPATVSGWTYSQFFDDGTAATTTKTDSGRIFSTQLRRDEFGYVKNQHNIIIGQVINDGWNIDFAGAVQSSADGTVTGFQACVDFTLGASHKRDPTLQLTMRDVGRSQILSSGNSSTSLAPIQIMGLQLPITTTNFCIPVQEGYTYFPLELVSNPNMVYSDTLPSGALPVLIVGVILYSIGILVLILLTIVDIKKNGRYHKTYIKPALVFMGSAFALRLAWIIYILDDPPSERVTVLFIELPSMLYWTLASLNLIRWIRPQCHNEDSCCSMECCLPKLKQFVWVILVLTIIIFIIMLIFILGDIGSSPAGANVAISAEQQIAEFSWFAFFVTFVFIELVWFAVLSICGICASGMDLFTPSEEGNNDQAGMNCAVIVSMLANIMVSVLQTALLVRVFLWEPFPGFVWNVTESIGLTMLFDFVPAIVLLACCLLSPFKKGTLFTREL